jgi:hypothetical protein
MCHGSPLSDGSRSFVRNSQIADSAALIEPRNVRVGIVFIWLYSVGSAVVPDEESQGQHGLAGDEEKGSGFRGHGGIVDECCAACKNFVSCDVGDVGPYARDK